MSDDWWIGIVGGVIGAVMTVAFEQIPAWWNRRRLMRSRWQILAAEIEVCRVQAQNYLHGNAPAPLYRLPMVAFEESIQSLVAEGNMSASQFTALVRFYAWAEDINRGLEIEHEVRSDPERLKKERDRVKSKCAILESTFLGPARDAIPAALRSI